MIGISMELEADLKQRGYSEADVLQFFGPKAYKGQLAWFTSPRPAIVRPGCLRISTPTTSAVDGWPSRSQMTRQRRPHRAMSHRCRNLYATGDRMALYRKGKQEAIFSTQQHANLVRKGIRVRPADNAARRLSASRGQQEAVARRAGDRGRLAAR